MGHALVVRIGIQGLERHVLHTDLIRNLSVKGIRHADLQITPENRPLLRAQSLDVELLSTRLAEVAVLLGGDNERIHLLVGHRMAGFRRPEGESFSAWGKWKVNRAVKQTEEAGTR